MPSSAKGTVTSETITASTFAWTIPDVSLLPADPNKCCNSPTFSFAGCNWKLTLYPLGLNADGWMSLYLSMDENDQSVKTVTFTLGLKKPDVCRLETEPLYHTFQKVHPTSGWSYFWNWDELQKNKSELAPSDSLVITCRMVNDVPPPVNTPKPLKLMELETLSTNFKELFVNKSSCDCTIKVKGEEFQAHRAVLMARCAAFASMFEHKLSEKESGVVTVEDCDPDSFGDFLHYLYTGTIEEVSFRNIYNLYVTADKYQVQELRAFCISYMMRNLNIENVCDVITLAEKYDDADLASSGQAFFNQNFTRIFSTAEWKKLLKRDYLLSYRLLEEMASSVGNRQDLTFTCMDPGQSRSQGPHNSDVLPSSAEIHDLWWEPAPEPARLDLWETTQLAHLARLPRRYYRRR